MVVRCAEKLPTGSRKKKHHAAMDVMPDLPAYPTNFGAIVKKNPPLAPPNLTRLTGGPYGGPKQNTGRVRIIYTYEAAFICISVYYK